MQELAIGLCALALLACLVALITGLKEPRFFGGGRFRVIMGTGVAAYGLIAIMMLIRQKAMPIAPGSSGLDWFLSALLFAHVLAVVAGQADPRPFGGDRFKALLATLGMLCVSGAVVVLLVLGYRPERDAAALAALSSQQAFIAAVVEGRQQFATARNPLARAGVQASRARALCAALQGQDGLAGRDRLEVRDWAGVIERLTVTHSRRRGVVTVRIDRLVVLRSWDADEGYADRLTTLIPFDSPLFRRIAALQVGQSVRFDGSFLASDEDCAQILNIGQREGMSEPEFLFRFTDIRAVE